MFVCSAEDIVTQRSYTIKKNGIWKCRTCSTPLYLELDRYGGGQWEPERLPEPRRDLNLEELRVKYDD